MHADTGILEVRPLQRLESSDFEGLTREVDAYLEDEGELNGVLICAESFPGWSDFAALLSHLRFVRDHQRRIRRVAVVSDSAFLTILPRVAEHFVQAEVRHFDYGDRDAAVAWLRGAGTPSSKVGSSSD